jgi:hypothetical protein
VSGWGVVGVCRLQTWVLHDSGSVRLVGGRRMPQQASIAAVLDNSVVWLSRQLCE